MKVRLFFLQLCVAALCLPGTAALARELTIATISDEPVKEIRTFLPFAKYLAGQLEDHGFDGGKVVIARDVEHMVSLLQRGEVDLFVDSPLVALAINDKAGSRFLARRWKTGVAAYHSVVFVRQDSGIASVPELADRVVAFETSYSSSGHLLPRIALEGMGLEVSHEADYHTESDHPHADFVFTGDDETTIEWVLRGRADAGAMSEASFLKLVAIGQNDLKIILETEEIPRHTVSIASGFPDQMEAALQTVLFTMHDSAEGQASLEAFERTARFDAMPAESLVLLDRFADPVIDLVSAD